MDSELTFSVESVNRINMLPFSGSSITSRFTHMHKIAISAKNLIYQISFLFKIMEIWKEVRYASQNHFFDCVDDVPNTKVICLCVLAFYIGLLQVIQLSNVVCLRTKICCSIICKQTFDCPLGSTFSPIMLS